MDRDILADQEYLFLGSRLKRLAERLQADALKIVREAGFEGLQPSFMPILAALARDGQLSVNQAMTTLGVSQPAVTRLVANMQKAGLITLERQEKDQRVKIIRLTPHGRTVLSSLQKTVWPRIEGAAIDLCRGTDGSFAEQITQVEMSLAQTPLPARGTATGLELVDYDDSLAGIFHDITREWVQSMFTLEPNDLALMQRPRELIIDKGGIILFAKDGLGKIVGTVALLRIEEGVYELTKMGVNEAARGKKAGEFLLQAVLERARAMKMKQLYLLTNSRCEAAIHLYEKLGFVHDADIMQTHGARYARCNVAMSYPIAA